MSSAHNQNQIKALLSEVRPNIGICQVIKAADQLYFKDKVLYTSIKPVIDITHKEVPTTTAAEGHPKSEQQKKEKKDHKNHRKDVAGKPAAGSKLQEVIEQAKKTVEEALNASQVDYHRQKSADPSQELGQVKAENAKLWERLEQQEQRLRNVEHLVKEISAKFTGL